MSQFFYTHQTCHPLRMFGMLWIDVYDSLFQLLTISSNFKQPFHRPQLTAWWTLCEGDVSHCMRQMVVTPDTDWFSDPHPYLFWRYLWPTDAYLYSQSCEIHRLGPNVFISIDLSLSLNHLVTPWWHCFFISFISSPLFQFCALVCAWCIRNHFGSPCSHVCFSNLLSKVMNSFKATRNTNINATISKIWLSFSSYKELVNWNKYIRP